MTLFNKLFSSDKATTPTQDVQPKAEPLPNGDVLSFDLDKAPVKLNPFDAINLTKDDLTLSTITLAAGWDPRRSGHDIDLDLSVHAYDATNEHVQTVYYARKRTRGIVHHGDNRTGAGDGDDEQISINFNKINPHIARLEVTVTSFSRTLFRDVKNAFVRLIDDTTGKEVARFNLSEDTGQHIGLRFGQFVKTATGWQFKALGVYSNDTIRQFNKSLANG